MNIIEREVGAIPVSIGTSLAFEGLLGIHSEQPKQPTEPNSIRAVWVNLRTLARNLYASMPSEDAKAMNYADAVEVLLGEVNVLPIALGQIGWPGKVVFYMPSKNGPKWMFPHAAFKDAAKDKDDKPKKRTPNQLAYEEYERFVSIELLHRMQAEHIPVLEIDIKPPTTEGTVALLTHTPHELLWKPLFGRLLLLESHTGKLKAYHTWYTKLNTIKEDTPLPFNEFTLQVFGDGQIIDGQSRKIREELKDMAQKKRWSGVTTTDKFYHDIMTGSPELKACYKTLRK